MAATSHEKSVQHLLQAFLVDSINKASKEDFLKRLSTFTLSTWSGKSEEISPLQCAKYGWYNSDVDVLKCSSCDSVLYGKLPNRFKTELYKVAVNKLRNELTDVHHKHCPWRTNPSPEPYYNISRWSKEEIKNEFLNNFNQLKSLKDALPILQDSYVNEIENSLEVLQNLFLDCQLTLQIVQLAVRGWSCNSSSDSNCCTLYCAYCVRRIGLWNYQTNEEINCESPPKKQKFSGDKIEKKKAFNPILEHQSWCSWVFISPGTDQFGWKIFLNALTNKSNKDHVISELSSKQNLCQVRKWLSI